MFSEFGQLPPGLKKIIKSVIGKNVEQWVHVSIPALHGRSIIEMMNLPNGEREVRLYLQRIESDSH